MNTRLYDVPSPAKINLFLHVVGRRPDGYHLLQTVFRFIDIYDWLNFERRPDGKIVRAISGATGSSHNNQVPEASDLIMQAALLLQQATGTKYGVQYNCQKNIPIGGGLGGGSSNAASTLIALNKLWGTGLGRSDLISLAARLGADVPVFVFGESAFAQGVGEELSSVSLNNASYLLVQPNAVVNTAAIFKHPDLTRNEKRVIITDFTEWQRSKLACTARSNTYFGRNSLEPVVFNLKPQVYKAAQVLKCLGYLPRMTGSGSCIFVEFDTAEKAGLIQQEISCKMQTRESVASRVIRQTWVCSGLNEHPLKHWIHS